MIPRTEHENERSSLKSQNDGFMYFKGQAAHSNSIVAEFKVTDEKDKALTVPIPFKGEVAAFLPRIASLFRCSCSPNIICDRKCKHLPFICRRVLNISEDKLKYFIMGKNWTLRALRKSLKRTPPIE